jgi:hypothetical protein
VEIALVLDELRDGDVLERDRSVGIGDDHRVAAAVIVGGGQDGLEMREHGVIDFDHARTGVEIADGDVAEIGREYKRIARRNPGRGGRLRRRAGLRAVGIAGCRPPSRRSISAASAKA